MTNPESLPEFPRLAPGWNAAWHCNTLHLTNGTHRVLLDGVPAALEHLITLLDGRHHIDHIGQAPDRPWITWLVSHLVRHGLLVASTPATQHHVHIIGTGRLAVGLATTLLAADRYLVRMVGRDSAPVVADLQAGCNRYGVRLTSATFVDDTHRADLAVVATDTCEPDRGITDQLTRAGTTHLVVRADHRRAIVGPMVVVGQTSCLRCADLRRSARDRQWPLLLYKRTRTVAPMDPLLMQWLAAVAACQVAGQLAGRTPETHSATVEMGADTGTSAFRRWRHHPECGCLATQPASAAA